MVDTFGCYDGSAKEDPSMPWREASLVALKKEFVELVKNKGNVSRVCKNFGISRQTGYKWIERYKSSGVDGLEDRSRRPTNSPSKVSAEIEDRIIELRRKHPAWGGRKLRRRLQDLEHKNVPSASTITAILKRNGMIDPNESSKHCSFQRFERERPNDLWQMDFKGHVGTPDGRCHPLTILDDCSRYALGLHACFDEKTETVQQSLIETFRRYGLPWQIITDNGSPWGDDGNNPFTRLGVWLIRNGIIISHSRPRHPQTMGKDERFHRTLKAELLGEWFPYDKEMAQDRFDAWRYEYNFYRPHEALDMEVPGRLYHVSDRPYSGLLPEIEYGPEDMIRKVQQGGFVHFQGRDIRIPKAFASQPIALRPRAQSDGCYDIYFVRQFILTIDLNDIPKKKV
jgi:transposase InsO family protein